MPYVAPCIIETAKIEASPILILKSLTTSRSLPKNMLLATGVNSHPFVVSIYNSETNLATLSSKGDSTVAAVQS